MKHVLLIHQAFATPNDPGGTRHFELIQRCRAEGFKFSVVTSQNRYADCRKLGVDGHWMSREFHQGTEVLRTYAFPAHHKNFLWRILAYLSFMCSSFAGAWKAGPVDLVWGTSPPIFQLISAWLIAALRRCPFLLEVRDLWPDFAIGMGILKNPILIHLSRWLENFLYSRADTIMVNSPAYRDYLLKKGILGSKIFLVANGVDTSQFDPAARGQQMRRRWGVGDKFVVTYAGALGPANAIDGILKAADRLRARQDIVIILAGAGKDEARLKKRAQKMALENICFVGPIPKSDIPAALAASDACIATLRNIPMFTTTYPNKIFDYMAAGRPTILAIGGVIAEVVSKAHGGIVVPPEDDSAMSLAIERLADDEPLRRRMGESARAYVQAHFERDKQAREFATVLNLAIRT